MSVEWQPIATAPKTGETVLLAYRHIDTTVVHAGFWMDEDELDNEPGWWSYTDSEVSRTLLTGWKEPAWWAPMPLFKPGL